MIRQRDLGDGVVLLSFASTGAMNTLTAQGNRELGELVDTLLADDAVAGIVFSSDNREFLVGGDIEELVTVAKPSDAIEIVRPFLGTLRRLEQGGKPIVAAINGAALGGGLEFALACHHRVAADLPGVRVGLPEVTLGLIPGGGGTQRLPRLIGIAPAAALLLRGHSLDAQDARAAGIIDEIVPADVLLEKAKAWVLAHPAPSQPWDVKGFQFPGFRPQSAEGRSFFSSAWADLHRKAGKDHKSGDAILMLLHHGLERNLDAAIQIETRYFARLAASPEAKAKIRTTFLGIREATAMKGRPVSIPKSVPTRVGVVGAGTMGRGIAYVSALAGMDVVILDASLEASQKSVEQISRTAEREHQSGRYRGSVDELMSRIRASASYSDLAGSDIVVEAVFERIEVKTEVLSAIAAAVGENTPIASNTSTIPIANLTRSISNPSRVLGLHFFSPVERMSLVELIKTAETSDNALAGSLDFLKRLGKVPVIVRDGLGFYTSRVVTTYTSEAMNLLGEGIPPHFIDNVARDSGFSIGPVSLIDLTTLPLLADIFTSMRGDGARTANEGSNAPQIVASLVAAGRRGKATGDGLYLYEGRERQSWPGFTEMFGDQTAAISPDDVRNRLFAVQSLEAVRALEENIVQRPIDGDLAAILGWGYPAYLGGPFSYIDRFGVRAFVEQCDKLADRFGGRFGSPQTLRSMAEDNRRFYDPH